MTAEHYDAFVSYGRRDADWVHTLAENLERLGLHVFLMLRQARPTARQAGLPPRLWLARQA